jgi:hypothetical protein
VCQREGMAERSRIIKVAGLSLVGFCAVSAVADKLPVSVNTTQIAGFCGAFVGALIGRYRKGKRHVADSAQTDLPVVPVSSESARGRTERTSDNSESASADG